MDVSVSFRVHDGASKKEGSETTHLQSALNLFSVNSVPSSADLFLAPRRVEVATVGASLSPCLPTSVRNISRSIYKHADMSRAGEGMR